MFQFELILAIFVIIFVSLIYSAYIYNKLISLKNDVKNAYAQICVQLKRRHNLIPNLVETVKGYSQHEHQTLENVIKARSQAVALLKNEDYAQISSAEYQLSDSLKSLFAVAEAYPELKADTNFITLQEELTTTENRIAYARQYFNDTVAEYNKQLQIFPNIFIASTFKFRVANFFYTTDNESPTVNVRF